VNGTRKYGGLSPAACVILWACDDVDCHMSHVCQSTIYITVNKPNSITDRHTYAL